MKFKKIILNTAIAAGIVGLGSQLSAADKKVGKLTMDKVPTAMPRAVGKTASKTYPRQVLLVASLVFHQ